MSTICACYTYNTHILIDFVAYILYNKTTRKAGHYGKSKHKYKFGSNA